MYLTVRKVIPQENYQLLLIFDNGEMRQFDMNPYLDLGLFKELKDQRLFQTVKPSFDTIEWANEADIDPETLYQESFRIDK
jgi:hypothetical protein